MHDCVVGAWATSFCLSIRSCSRALNTLYYLTCSLAPLQPRFSRQLPSSQPTGAPEACHIITKKQHNTHKANKTERETSIVARDSDGRGVQNNQGTPHHTPQLIPPYRERLLQKARASRQRRCLPARARARMPAAAAFDPSRRPRCPPSSSSPITIPHSIPI